MPNNKDRDQTVEQWLRQTPASAARGDDCLDADTLAAWFEGSLEGSERSSAEAHAANCARCQAMLAVMVRTTPVPAARSGSPIRKWLMMLGPAMAAAAAVALWFAVDQGQRSTPLVDSLRKEQAKVGRAPESRVAASPVPTEQEADRKAPGASLDREVPKDSAAPKMLADARRKREERVESPVVAPPTVPPVNERKDLAAATPAAAPAPPAPPAAPAAAAETVQTVAGNRPVNVAPPGPAPQQQANQIPNQNQAQGQTQVQNQAPARQQAAEPLAERVIVTAEQPKARAAGDSASAGRAGAMGGVAGGLADAAKQGYRADAGTFNVVVPASSVRWRVVDGRTVQRSSDAGTTWANQYTAENNMTLVAGASPTPSVCWLVGRGGTIVRTTDGLVWQRLTFPEAVDLTAVISSDARTATVTAADGRKFTTADGGRTWTRQ